MIDNPLIIDTSLHWVAVIIYICGTVINAMAIIFAKPRAEKLSLRAMIAGLLIHGLALAYRWLYSGHGPYVAQYEILSSGAWVSLLFYLLYRKKHPCLQPLSIIIFPAIFLLIAYSLFSNPAIQQLPPSLRSIWLVIHVAFYKLALAAIIVALACSVFQIFRDQLPVLRGATIPTNPELDSFSHRFAGFGFIFWAVAMLSGSIWAYQSWGRYWGWDPIESWSLITWLLFGLYLHLRKFYHWQGERAAWLYIVCFGCAIFALFFASLIDTSIHAAYFQQ